MSSQTVKRNNRSSQWVWIALLIMALSGAFFAVSHYGPLPDAAWVAANNPPPSKEWYLEQMPRYQSHPLLTAVHVQPAAVLMLMIPLQLSRRLRTRRPVFHRAVGRSFVVSGVVLSVAGIIIGFVMPFGGLDETVFSTLMGAGFLSCLIMGVMRARQGHFKEHRHWMSRMLAFGFAPVTMRVIMTTGVIAFDLDASTIFGWTLGVGFIINLALVEWWLSRTSNAPVVTPASTALVTDNL